MAQLASPPMSSMESLSLPRGSVLHFLPEDELQYGLSGDDWLLRDVERLVMVDHVVTLSSEKGNPRSTHLADTNLIRQYHRTNRKLKPLRSLETQTRDDRTLLVENYALLPHLYRYTPSVYGSYYKWYNIAATMWQTVAKLTTTVPTRQQFIKVTLPDTLPSLASFKKAESNVTRSTLEPFSNNDSLFLLELWKWLGETRAESMLSVVKDDRLDRVNLILQEADRWTVVNLGALNEWRKDPEGGAIEPVVMQKRFLRMVMTVYEAGTVVGGTPSEKPKSTVEPDDTDDTTVFEKDAVDTPEEASKDESLEIDLDALNEQLLNALQEQDTFEVPEELSVATNDIDHAKGVMTRAERLASDGLISAAEFRRFEKLSEAYKTLPNPYTGTGSLVDQARISAEDLVITGPTVFPDSETIVDKSMLESTLVEFDKSYVKNVLPKDITNSVLAIQQAGFAVTSYDIEDVEDVGNHYEIHTVRVTPVSGSPSTVRFRIPKVQEDGTYLANGVKYRLRKQRGDLPIRKVNPGRVALTSYYGKVFVNRSERSTEDYSKWLTNQITTLGFDDNSELVTELKASNVFDSAYTLPRMYTLLSKRFRSFTAGGVDFFLEYAKREEHFGAEAVKAAETNDMVVIGRRRRNLVVVDLRDTLYEVKGSELVVIGKVEDLIELSLTTAPTETADLMVFSKQIPMGVALGYYLGLEGLLKRLGVTTRRVRTGERLLLDDNEFALRFEDETLVVNREDKLAALVLSGFNRYKKALRHYTLTAFNRPEVYQNLLEQAGLGTRFIREMDLLRNMFVDPITRDLLVDMKEPTDWVGLLFRSSELLLTDYSPAETDMSQMRIKGYERLAGQVYGQLVQSARTYEARQGGVRNQLELSPHAVWQSIQEDPSKSLVEESNPIQNLKEKELVTYGGTGGRSRRSMVKRSRIYHRSDMGIISEATPDSGDVGINTYLTANPNFKTLRGTTAAYDAKEDGASNLLSTSALLSPAADSDDPKRVNFISIQHGSGVAAKGYKPTPLRTGYEQVLAQRTDDLFAYTAKQPGKITKVSKSSITITYEDGSTHSVELGRRFGTAAGSVFPHSVVTQLSVGDTVEPGKVVAYNEDYFTPDTLNPGKVVWKAGLMVKTAIAESPDTLEDSSAISEKIADALTTNMTKVRTLVIPFDNTVRRMVAAGTQVDSESILCTIEDAVTADNDLFNEDTLDTLRVLSANTPRAKYAGTVERIEVFYHGDLEDMSDSLRALAMDSDKALAKRRKAMGKPVVTGSVDGGVRFESNPLELDSVAIKLYITTPVSAGIGDKGVFGNQLKTVIGRVMGGVNETESGTEVDAIFGYQSISDRIVLSPEIMGTTNTLLRVISQRVAKVYRGS